MVQMSIRLPARSKRRPRPGLGGPARVLDGCDLGAAAMEMTCNGELVSSGSGDETQVSISGYLMPGLQLQYGMGVFTSISEVRLRYELMPRLYVQVMSGLNQALDLFYKFEF